MTSMQSKNSTMCTICQSARTLFHQFLYGSTHIIFVYKTTTQRYLPQNAVTFYYTSILL